MKPARKIISIILWIGVCVFALSAGAGWFTMKVVLPRHVKKVTGRDDVSAPNCFYCHRPVDMPPREDQRKGPVYMSPGGLEISPDGSRLYVAAQGADQIIVVALPEGTIQKRVELPGRPHGLRLSPDGSRLAVSIRDQGIVRVYQASTLETVATLQAGREPLDLAWTSTADQLYVADGSAGLIWRLSMDQSIDPVALIGGRDPYAVDRSRDGKWIIVANRMAFPVPAGIVPESEITLIQTQKNQVTRRFHLRSAHLSEGVVLSSDARFALAPAIRVRNLLPITQVARGGLMNSALAFIDLNPNGRVVQFPLDEVNAAYADPAGVALTPDDRIAFVAHAGANCVTAVNVAALEEIVRRSDRCSLDALADDLGAFSQYVLARIPTQDAPQGLRVAPDGRRLYVAERLNDSIAVIDVERLQVVDRFDLGGADYDTPERRGERVFYNAAGSFHGEFSCRSCHPDGNTDGIIWDFDIDGLGRNLVVTRSLRGIRDTAPFKWNGKNPSLHVQCGPRFSKVLTRTDPFPEDKLDDLVAYIKSIPLPPERIAEQNREAVERGKRLFRRTRTNQDEVIPVAKRCPTCHRPPLFTDRLMAEVGTAGPLDSGRRFDTPQLLDVSSHAPYLHDGRARTLEEIWTVFNPDDEHGVTNDMSKEQLNDLILFLKSL